MAMSTSPVGIGNALVMMLYPLQFGLSEAMMFAAKEILNSHRKSANVAMVVMVSFMMTIIASCICVFGLDLCRNEKIAGVAGLCVHGAVLLVLQLKAVDSYFYVTKYVSPGLIAKLEEECNLPLEPAKVQAS